jgi:DNA-binding CsgD family transcriptional regulator
LPRREATTLADGLTTAERRVLELLSRGRAPKQVALELHVALSTVRSHIASAKRRTGARTVEELVGIFVEAERARTPR